MEFKPPDEIFDLAYQGPLEARPWLGLLECLRHRLECDATAISLRPSQLGIAPKTIWSRRDGVADSELERLVLQVALAGHANPVGEALRSSGDVLRLSDVLGATPVETHPYCRVMMTPFGFRFQIGMRIVERAGWVAHLGFFNTPARGDFGAEHIRLLKALCPHMERALEIYARLKRSESEKRIFEDSLDRLMIGAFILDGHGKIIEANRVGELILIGRSVFSIIDDRLCMSRSMHNKRFQSTLAAALTSHAQDPTTPFVDAIRFQDTPEGDIGILVRSVQAIDPYTSKSLPCAVVYVSGWPKSTHSTRYGFVGELFGLTPSEAKLALLLAEGVTIPDAAQQLGITEISARTNLKRIFAKTGITRQVDLVRLILRSVAILA